MVWGRSKLASKLARGHADAIQLDELSPFGLADLAVWAIVRFMASATMLDWRP
jgi:hypothetical protein